MSHMQSARAEESLLCTKGNPNLLKVALDLNLKLSSAAF